MSGKEILGLAAVLLTLAAYVPYFWSIFRRQTKPHIFSWIVGGIVNITACAAQLSRGGGAGAWTAGVTGLLCIIVVVLAVPRGEKNITRGDWAAFIGALSGVLLWYFTQNPLTAVILATLTDVLGLFPTFRKSYAKPHEEALSMWSLASLRSLLAVFALEHYSAVTVIYPASMIFLNGAVAVMLIWRRAVLRKGKNA